MIRQLVSALVCFWGVSHLEAQSSGPAPEAGPNAHKLIAIPAGEYQLGVDGNLYNPQHKIKIESFRISDAETTNAQFAAFVRATGYVTDAEKRGFGKIFREGMDEWVWTNCEGANWRMPFGPQSTKATEQPDHPVTQISGGDAEAYCKWVGGRLPTLDEWEVAARAGSAARWPWGAKFLPGRANIWNGKTHQKEVKGDGFLYTAPVRSFPPNAWGLYDVIGNVFEYCSNVPLPLNGSRDRLSSARGGSWWCSEKTCDSFNLEVIGRMDKHGSLANQGFRVVFDKDKPRK